MPHAVFISHSSKDKITADAVCAVLERNGIPCWIAPRDVIPGAVWGTAIVEAIQSAKIMVLILTNAADSSPLIQREVERAVSKEVVVIPFRVENVEPKGLEYFISSSHWMDAFTEPLEQHLEALAKVIKSILEAKRSIAEGTPIIEPAAEPRASPPPGAGTASPAPSSPPPSFDRGRFRRAYGGIAAIVLLGVCVILGTLVIRDNLGPVRTETKTSSVSTADFVEMVTVPAGHFRMGASPDEQSIFDWPRPFEQPVHEVTFAKPFAVGRFPITRDQYEAFIKDTNTPVDSGCTFWDGKADTVDPTRSFRDPKLAGGPQAGNHPVVCVSFKNAEKFVNWLSLKTGKPYRLLSDAEREYVTRAGTTAAFWWGSSITPQQANYWYDSSYKGSPTQPGRWTTVPVKYFQPNPWGLYQVHGNVAEYVADCWHPDLTGAPSDGSARHDGDCAVRTVRNGAFMNNADLSRSAQRRSFTDLGGISAGFRVAMTLPE